MELNGKKVLITGGAGFLGSHLCDRFVKEGYHVIAMDNLSTGSLKNIEHLFPLKNFEFYFHDVTKFVHIPGELDCILHFASPASPIDYLKMPIQTLKVGSLGTHNLLGLAKEKGSRFLIASTSEIYGDPDEKIVYPAPSWNNNCYVQLVDCVPVSVETKFENNFVPTAEELKPHLRDAALFALNSPNNPSGTVFTKEELKKIVDLIVDENKQRAKENRKPLYVFYDMIYWILVYGETKHYNPIELNPEIRDYVVFIDGISKCFAATGVRLGWAFGPKEIIKKMSAILAHIGAWSPKPEQVATGRFLNNTVEVDKFFDHFKNELFTRLNIFFEGIMEIKKSGYDVDAIYPQGALYLTVKLNLVGKKTEDGKVLKTIDDVLGYVLEEGKIALVPFYAFGAKMDSPWFRLSVGTCSKVEANIAVLMLKEAIEKLK